MVGFYIMALERRVYNFNNHQVVASTVILVLVCEIKYSDKQKFSANPMLSFLTQHATQS